MRYSLVFICFFILHYVQAQNGGNSTYQFLNVPVSARVGGMGGSALSIKDDDPNLTHFNPSLLTPAMSTSITLTYLNFFADINYGYVSYIHDFKKWGTFSGGVNYINYGQFKETDSGGNEMGNFTAGEYAFVLGWGRSIDSSFSVGANLKPIYSNLYEYNSFGMAADIAATYYKKSSNIGISVLLKNMGMQLTTYVEGREREPIPFEIQAGVSKKLKYVPIRLSLDFHNLQNWNLAYNDSTYLTNTNKKLSDEDKAERNQVGYFDELFRHIVIGAEVIPSKSFSVRFGFNVKRRAELGLDDQAGLSGLSWGFGFRVKKFYFSYGSARYHLAGSSNHFSVTTNIGDYYKKETVSDFNQEKPIKDKKQKKSRLKNENNEKDSNSN
ncbi:MAG: type IX secretion system protein PorQ [Flavobacteriales bacterium]|nr:type IX secretion system protein PorQ [Flavobacteriales bacterium]